MNRTIGLVTANFSIAGFGTIGEERPSVSIPFGGRYRLMDFALSNMVNARIQTVGMITPYRYRSIIDHVGAGKEWDLDRKSGGLYILPGTVYGFRDNDGHFLFRDFLQNQRYFQIEGDYILVSSGALVCNIDYQPMIARHELSGREVTLLYRRTDPDFRRRGYYLTFNEKGLVSQIRRDDHGEFLFLDSFIINKALLLRLMKDYGNLGQLDLLDLLGMITDTVAMDGYVFDGYVAFMNGTNGYLRSSLDLMDYSVRRELFNPERKILTKIHDTPPALYTSDSRVRSALVAAGSIVEGTVENSIVFRSVRIEKGAVVRNCVIMDKCVIKSDAVLENVICDRSVTVTAGTRIQGTPDSPCVLPKGGII
jgi:glucose-1-phosphate adenylyltransferase, GlgD subunit